VTFVASAGDSGASSSWPASSDEVVAVGGTTLNISSSGTYESETAWSDSGGGYSRVQLEPSYQSSVNTTGYRSIPDVAYDANPSTGFAVYTATAQSGQTGWFEVGGTSAGAPQWAALFAIADQGRGLAGKGTLDGGTQTLPTLYSLPASDFHDITSGSNGYRASTGYDLVTGRGSPIANLVVSDLVASTTTTPLTTISGTSTNRYSGRNRLPVLFGGGGFRNRFDEVDGTGIFQQTNHSSTPVFNQALAAAALAAAQKDILTVALTPAVMSPAAHAPMTEARIEDSALPPAADEAVLSDIPATPVPDAPADGAAESADFSPAAEIVVPDSAGATPIPPAARAVPHESQAQAIPLTWIAELHAAASAPVKSSPLPNFGRIALVALTVFTWFIKPGKKQSGEQLRT
jgi:hypothetical protein